ncbi:aspartoacylase [Endozoicomonas lisbonensis]|uniref:Succinylglutamate desuccinylase n=1 Tax=Endozoicomonas lisbonensis TaxID=3120522 RepID=A0ABV2SJS6_9GAMM
MIQEITLTGGTHGNEYLGPTIIQRLDSLGTYQNSNISVSTLLANPRATKAGVRFIDEDLNRCFSDDVLSASGCTCYEHLRAREINRQLGPRPNRHRFLIDLHSTTANMGMTLILRDRSPFNLQAAAYAQQKHPGIKLILSDLDQKYSRTLNSICEFGLTIEVGPIANAVIRHDLLLETEEVIASLVEFINLSHHQHPINLPDTLTAYRVCERVLYPRSASGDLTAMVHKQLQDRDFIWLDTGDPAFFTLQGKTLPHTGRSGYPIFINEAAYYRENTAFIITEQLLLDVDHLKQR